MTEIEQKKRGRPKLSRETTYFNERIAMCNKILNILSVNDDNNKFIMNDITDEQIAAILLELPNIKIYYDTAQWQLSRKDNNLSLIMTLIRYILKENNINYISSSIKVRENNVTINKQLYVIN